MNSDALLHRRKMAELNKILRRNNQINNNLIQRIEVSKNEIENLKKNTKNEAQKIKDQQVKFNDYCYKIKTGETGLYEKEYSAIENLEKREMDLIETKNKLENQILLQKEKAEKLKLLKEEKNDLTRRLERVKYEFDTVYLLIFYHLGVERKRET